MSLTSRDRGSPIFILGALFFLFGFVTWLNGALIPYLRIACELDTFSALFVTFAFYIAYFFTALPGAWLLRRIGLKNGMMTGLLVMAFGALLFIPAAQARAYGLFLTGLFIIGTGLSVLQTAANPYITIVGPVESAARRISIMGICNKVAGVLAPIALGYVVLSDGDSFIQSLEGLTSEARAERLDGLARRVILPYAGMAAVLVALAFMVRLGPLPDIEPEGEGQDGTVAGRDYVLSYPWLVLGVLALFLYVGVEVIAADTIGLYGQTQGVPLTLAPYLTSLTLGGMVLGYMIGIITIPRFISQERALWWSALLGITLTLAALFTEGMVSVLCIALLGLANALVWPAIWPLAIRGLGRHTKVGSALLIMAIAGGALLPLLYGHLSDLPAVGPRSAYAMLLPCYVFIGWFALRGARIQHW